MTFLAPAMLLGLAGLLAPVILHLLARRAPKVVEWGAMRFLRESLARRRWRMKAQEFLLLLLRMLVPVVAALAMARPFLSPGTRLSGVAGAGLLALAAGLAALAVVARRRPRAFAAALAALCAAAALLLLALEHKKRLALLDNSGEGDWVIVVDASPSTTLADAGETPLERARREAREVIEAAPPAAAFALIAGGPLPEARVLRPTRDRDALLRALEAIQPLPGGMDAVRAFSLAAVALSEGTHPRKGVLVLSDTHRDGWSLDAPGVWAGVRELFDRLPGGRADPPRVRLVAAPSPGYARNLALNRPRFSRAVIGADREVTILADLENHGREAATPRKVVLRVEDRVAGEFLPPSVHPGEVQSVRFRHRFPRPGFFRVSIALDADDDLAFDNTVSLVAAVAPPLRVLLVEPRPSAPRAGRAAFFAAHALQPSLADAAHPPMQVKVVPLSGLAAMRFEDAFDAVVLPEVDALAPEVATRLGAFAERGGGVLIAPGPSADAAFYNGWLAAATPEGAGIRMVAWREPKEEQPLRMASRPAVPGATGAAGALDALEVSEVRIFGAWELAASRDDDATPLRLQQGEPLFALTRRGSGGIGVLALPLDTAWSNLPAHAAYVPLLHGLLHRVAGASDLPVNLPADWRHETTWRHPSFARPKEAAPPDQSPLEVKVTGGEDRSGRARWSPVEGGARLLIADPLQPGVYEMAPPPGIASRFAGWLPSGASLPLCIQRPAGESRWNPLTPEDLLVLKNALGLTVADSAPRSFAGLEEQSAGRELWRVLLFLLIGVMLSESLFAAFITWSRRPAEGRAGGAS